jgi:hypothetical protein
MEHITDNTNFHTLLLHFDINKTLLMKDSSKRNDTFRRVLVSLISAQAWGEFNEDDQTWTLASKEL